MPTSSTHRSAAVVAVESFIADHPAPTREQLAAAGLAAPSWPRPWGIGANPAELLQIDTAFERARIDVPHGEIGLGWAGPTILAGGTEEQQRRWLPGILDGSHVWCQLFSEPDAGSDLASLRTSAVRDGDHYIVSGQKIWSTWADHSDFGILLARTSSDGAPQTGITYFVIDMASPGIEVRPIVEMTGGNHFNEVFLDEVRIPVANRIGEENEGWRLAKVTLGNERLSLSEGGVIWGMGPTSNDFFNTLKPTFGGELGPLSDPNKRQDIARTYTGAKIIEYLTGRIAAMVMAGTDATAFASIRKTLADEHGQRITSLYKDLCGSAAMLGSQVPEAKDDDPWHWAYLFSRALTIGGGTSEVQRNIIGERLLGLPKEPPPTTVAQSAGSVTGGNGA